MPETKRKCVRVNRIDGKTGNKDDGITEDRDVWLINRKGFFTSGINYAWLILLLVIFAGFLVFSYTPVYFDLVAGYPLLSNDVFLALTRPLFLVPFIVLVVFVSTRKRFKEGYL